MLGSRQFFERLRLLKSEVLKPTPAMFGLLRLQTQLIFLLRDCFNYLTVQVISMRLLARRAVRNFYWFRSKMIYYVKTALAGFPNSNPHPTANVAWCVLTTKLLPELSSDSFRIDAKWRLNKLLEFLDLNNFPKGQIFGSMNFSRLLSAPAVSIQNDNDNDNMYITWNS